MCIRDRSLETIPILIIFKVGLEEAWALALPSLPPVLGFFGTPPGVESLRRARFSAGGGPIGTRASLRASEGSCPFFTSHLYLLLAAPERRGNVSWSF